MFTCLQISQNLFKKILYILNMYALLFSFSMKKITLQMWQSYNTLKNIPILFKV